MNELTLIGAFFGALFILAVGLAIHARTISAPIKIEELGHGKPVEYINEESPCCGAPLNAADHEEPKGLRKLTGPVVAVCPACGTEYQWPEITKL